MHAAWSVAAGVAAASVVFAPAEYGGGAAGRSG